ncbi:UNVERIFIED_CONTAM: hypothetical protein Cloal_1163 [Acetivibrio alkalicellulosi]
MKKLILILVLISIILTSCSQKFDTLEVKELQLKPEIIELLDNKEVEIAIIGYTESLIEVYNNREKDNGMILPCEDMKRYSAVISEYSEKEVPSNIFSLDIPFEELDLRMERLKKILEVQEISALIEKLSLETKATTKIPLSGSGEITTVYNPDEDDILEIKEKILDLIESFFVVS